MLKMAIGHTEQIDGARAAEELVAQCSVMLDGLTPDAGLLLASHDVDLDGLVVAINKALPGLALIGCTVVAPVSSGAPYSEGATTLTLIASDVVDFTSGLGMGVAEDVGAAIGEAVSRALAGTSKRPALAVSMPSLEGIDPAAVTEELGRALGPDIPLFGGGAVPDYAMTGTWLGARQIYRDRVLTDAVPLLLLSGPLVVSVGVRHGWRVVGRPAIVTRSKGNKVYEIDGDPVVDFYRHYIGPELGPAIANPLAILDPASGRHVLLAPLDWDLEEGSATFFGSVPEGASVQVSMASVDEILEGGRSSVADALAGFPAGLRPAGALISACAVRNILLGTRTRTEVANIKAGLGEDLPVAGFYAFGEFAPLGAGRAPSFHNETCVTVLLGA